MNQRGKGLVPPIRVHHAIECMKLDEDLAKNLELIRINLGEYIPFRTINVYFQNQIRIFVMIQANERRQRNDLRVRVVMRSDAPWLKSKELMVHGRLGNGVIVLIYGHSPLGNGHVPIHIRPNTQGVSSFDSAKIVQHHIAAIMTPSHAYFVDPFSALRSKLAKQFRKRAAPLRFQMVIGIESKQEIIPQSFGRAPHILDFFRAGESLTPNRKEPERVWQ